jgi:hypothetical protein
MHVANQTKAQRQPIGANLLDSVLERGNYRETSCTSSIGVPSTASSSYSSRSATVDCVPSIELERTA